MTYDLDIEHLEQTSAGVAERIRNVMVSAYRVEAELIGVSDFAPLERTAAQISGADGSFLGVFVGKRLAAVAEVEVESGNRGTIAALVVAPAFFRRGLGDALVRRVIRDHGSRRLRVSTGCSNGPALALYTGLGFLVDLRWTTDDGIPMVTLVREPA